VSEAIDVKGNRLAACRDLKGKEGKAMETTIVNCTPHPLTVFNADGGTTIIPPSGIVPRVKELLLGLDEAVSVPSVGRVDLSFITTGEIAGLPPKDGRMYVCPRAVAEAAVRLGRDDVWFPSDFVRDGCGRVLGYYGFARFLSI
jgi:hypothetical protein